MSLFRKKPIVVEATQWFANGDHPHDQDGMDDFEKQNNFEGKVVRYFRSPDVPAHKYCQHCGFMMHAHGWIDTLEGDHIVCPGDWVITGVQGESYPCKPAIFEATYEAVV